MGLDSQMLLQGKPVDTFFQQASVRELARTAYFGSLSVIPEDFIKENGGQFSCEFKQILTSHKVQRFQKGTHMGYQFGLNSTNYKPRCY